MGRAILLMILTVWFTTGCVKRIPLPDEKLEKGSRVWVTTIDRRELDGDVIIRKPDRFVIRTAKGQVDTILFADVARVLARPQEYDEAGRLIPEHDIDSVKANTNLFLYTLGGGALSFGASFYLGNFLKRHVNTGKQLALWGITGGGTALGVLAFANAGARRDRLLAIEKIKDYRKTLAEKQIEEQKDRKARLEEELKRLKEEQKRQLEELERLKKLLEEKKKAQPSPPEPSQPEPQTEPQPQPQE